MADRRYERVRAAAPLVALAAGAFGATLFGFAAVSGPLDPPAEAVDGSGEPVSTQPSLADLEAKVDAIAATSGPWEVAYFSATPDSTDQLASVEVVSGRVFVNRLIVYQSHAALFDGPGSIDDAGRITSGQLVATGRSQFLSAGTGRGQLDSVTIDAGIIVENGLYWSYGLHTTNAIVQVQYRRLD